MLVIWLMSVAGNARSSHCPGRSISSISRKSEVRAQTLFRTAAGNRGRGLSTSYLEFISESHKARFAVVDFGGCNFCFLSEQTFVTFGNKCEVR
jgi:hypothetical protein